MNTPIHETMIQLGESVRTAAAVLAAAPGERRNAALMAAARDLEEKTDMIRAANERDMAAAKEKGLSRAMLDRLHLTEDRIRTMAEGVREIAALPDPVGTVLEQWDRPSGLHIKKVRVPLGVIGIIYESRPNVTADAAALALKSGNGAILRPGSESFNSAEAIMRCLREGLEAADLPGAVQMIPTTDRAAVGELLTMTEHVDVIVPRGGKSLIERVTAESRIPLFKHLEGICHTYVHEKADPALAEKVVVNAKLRRTGLCNTTETLLVDETCAETLLPRVCAALKDGGCHLKGDEKARKIIPDMNPATEEDWETEYLDAILSVKVVADMDDALAHIRRFGSGHTEAILTTDEKAAETFMNRVDAAVVMHNTSTQFNDGGQFGMGAEIGISTGKLHARGPIGVNQLTSFTYQVKSNGCTRP